MSLNPSLLWGLQGGRREKKFCPFRLVRTFTIDKAHSYTFSLPEFHNSPPRRPVPGGQARGAGVAGL